MRRYTKASVQPRQEVTKGRVGNTWGRNHRTQKVEPRTPRARVAWKRPESQRCVEQSAWRHPEIGLGMGSGGGGEALTEMQRSKNAAKESCVASSASVADIKSLVTVRVGPV